MPTKIAENHEYFMKRFFHTGIPRKYGVNYPNLFRNKKGYLIPII